MYTFRFNSHLGKLHCLIYKTENLHHVLSLSFVSLVAKMIPKTHIQWKWSMPIIRPPQTPQLNTHTHTHTMSNQTLNLKKSINRSQTTNPQFFRNVSGLHRRLLDGSSRQLAVVVNPTNATDDTQLTASTASADAISGPTNISNSTSSLASNPSPSISIACHSAVYMPTTSATTTLASISSYPMIAPSSCIALRRPSANMFVRLPHIRNFSWN